MNLFDFARFACIFISLAMAGSFWHGRFFSLLVIQNYYQAGLPKKYSLLAVAFLAILLVRPGGLIITILEFSILISLLVAIIWFFALSYKIGGRGWVLVGGVVCTVLLVYSFFGVDYILVRYAVLQRQHSIPGFDNIRHFSDVAAGLMPLTLLYIVSRSRPSLIAAFLCFLPLSFWWYLLFLTEGRAGILSLTLAMVVALVLFGRAARWPVVTLFSSALTGLAGWWFINPLRRGLESGEYFHRNIASDNNRFDLWRTAIEYSIEYFPFGIGPMQFAGDGRISYAHAHNLILNTAAEWGIPIALMLLALILFGCWKIYLRSRVIPEADKPLYACLVMAFVGVMVNVQFAGAHIIPLSSLVMALAIGLVFGYRDSSQPPVERLAGPVPIQAKLLWVGIMLMMAYLFYASMELYQLSMDSRMLCMQEAGHATLYPRFWTQGRLECMQMVAPDHWLFWSWR